jgi:hypothetical protein
LVLASSETPGAISMAASAMAVKRLKKSMFPYFPGLPEALC